MLRVLVRLRGIGTEKRLQSRCEGVQQGKDGFETVFLWNVN